MHPLESGKSCSKNFLLDTKITSYDELAKHLQDKPSIFWRHRLYPCAFVISQQFRLIKHGIETGLFWTVKPKKLCQN